MNSLNEQQMQFISQITPIVQKYAEIYGYNQSICPAIVAQACKESSFGTSTIATAANNLFGIKHGGKDVYYGLTYDTVSQTVVPTSNETKIDGGGRYWRAYDDINASVEGYFKFLDEHSAYSVLKTIDDPQKYALKVGGLGYANNSADYGNSCASLMNMPGFQTAYQSGSSSNVSTSNTSSLTLSSDSVVIVDYTYIKNIIGNLGQEVKNTSIMNRNTLSYDISNNSATFAEINNILNNYTNNTKSFLSSFNNTCTSMFSMIANESFAQDQSLASSFGKTLNANTPILSEFNKFYSDYPILSNIEVDFNSLNLSKEFLISAMSENNRIIGSLSEDLNEYNNMIKVLDNMISAPSENLSGPAWTAAKQVLGEYQETFNNLITYTINLQSSIVSSIKSLLDSMGEYDNLNMNDKPLLEQSQREIAALKASLESTLASIPPFSVSVDENGKETRIDNSAIRAQYEAAIRECQVMLTEIANVLSQLNQMVTTDQNVASGLSGSSISTGMPSGGQSSPLIMPTLNNNGGINNENIPSNNVTVSEPESNKISTTNNAINNNNNEEIVYNNQINNDSLDNDTTNKEDNLTNDLIDDFEDETITDNNNLENEIIESPIEQSPNNESTQNTSNKNGILKTMGIVTGIAGVAGATAYGIKKSKENNGTEEE